MDKIEIKGHSKYFFIATFLLFIIISVVIIFPFFTTILGSIIITYIFYPLYTWLLGKIKNKNLASLIVSLFILIILVVPIMIATNAIIHEAVGLFYEIRKINLGIEDFSNTILSKYIGESIEISEYFRSALNKLSLTILQQTDDFILKLPEKLINFFVMFFIIFFLFKDGKSFVEYAKNELPLREKYKQILVRNISNTVYATVYGVLGAAFAQGLVAVLGFYIFNVNSPLFLGFLIFIAAIIPFFGSALIWLPVAIIKIISGDNFNGIGLLIYGIVAISSIDNLIKVKIIESGTKLHPILSLLGVLGGLQIFGLLGVVVKTFKQTPLLKGADAKTGRFLLVLKERPSAGDLDLEFLVFRLPFRSCLIVGMIGVIVTKIEIKCQIKKIPHS